MNSGGTRTPLAFLAHFQFRQGCLVCLLKCPRDLEHCLTGRTMLSEYLLFVYESK